MKLSQAKQRIGALVCVSVSVRAILFHFSCSDPFD